MARIYAVEDDDNIRELVCYALRSAGLEPLGFENAAAFKKQLNTELPQLVLLDIMLPDEDGLKILRGLRENSATAALPVILLTARGTEYDRVTGLDTGADDYIVKPFSVLELLSRIRAVLRRTETKTVTHTLQAGALMLDTLKREVTINGESVALTFKEFELLQYMMENTGVALSRDRLLTQIWGYDYDGGTNRTVDMHIKTLRQKLGLGEDMIQTVRGLGYKLIVPRV